MRVHDISHPSAPCGKGCRAFHRDRFPGAETWFPCGSLRVLRIAHSPIFVACSRLWSWSSRATWARRHATSDDLLFDMADAWEFVTAAVQSYLEQASADEDPPAVRPAIIDALEVARSADLLFHGCAILAPTTRRPLGLGPARSG